MSSNISDITDWNTSWADEIPNGSQVNMYLLNGVLKVPSFALSWSSFTCQKPKLASNTENTFVFGIHAGDYFLDGSHRIVLTFDGFVQTSWIYAYSQLTIWFYYSDHAIYPVSRFVYPFDDV